MFFFCKRDFKNWKDSEKDTLRIAKLVKYFFHFDL